MLKTFAAAVALALSFNAHAAPSNDLILTQAIVFGALHDGCMYGLMSMHRGPVSRTVADEMSGVCIEQAAAHFGSNPFEGRPDMIAEVQNMCAESKMKYLAKYGR